MTKKTAGILLSITSLFNRFPIGDVGPAASAFADFMAKSGQCWWQMLPIGPLGENNSPYQTASAFAGNPLLISPERLVEQALLDKKDIALFVSRNNGRVNYHSASQLKLRLLKKAFWNFEKKTDKKQFEFDTFSRAESAWLDDFSLFSAIQSKEGTADWTRWDSELRLRKPKALAHAKKYLANDIRYHQFVQWQFALQWETLRTYCTSKGIRLIGDIPLFVAHHSHDVWAHPDIFKLSPDGKPAVIAGVPPDYFSKTGQVWHVPVYRWDVLKQQNYSWWLDRLRIMLGRFDRIRLDNFIGFVRTYEIPANAKTAKQGQYHACGGLPFFKAVHKAFGVLPFIADDLGTVIPAVERLRQRIHLPGTKVLQFELDATINADFQPVEAYPVQSVVYTGTHDNNTSIGWYRTLPLQQRKSLCAELHTPSRDFNWAMIRRALAAKSTVAIIPMQDILGLGSEARMNVPGKMKGNWQWRLMKSMLTEGVAKKMKKFIQTAGRENGVSNGN